VGEVVGADIGLTEAVGRVGAGLHAVHIGTEADRAEHDEAAGDDQDGADRRVESAATAEATAGCRNVEVARWPFGPAVSPTTSGSWLVVGVVCSGGRRWRGIVVGGLGPVGLRWGV